QHCCRSNAGARRHCCDNCGTHRRRGNAGARRHFCNNHGARRRRRCRNATAHRWVEVDWYDVSICHGHNRPDGRHCHADSGRCLCASIDVFTIGKPDCRAYGSRI
ncbi:unnamed protein product, partial [Ectocarpus sp. 13 AM-2016]